MKIVKGFENYAINENGDIFSLERIEKVTHNGKTHNRKRNGKKLSPCIDKYGYPAVRLLRNDGRAHPFTIHRLVAMAFIPNPDNLPQVNHKNGIKTDNRIENLEWCSIQYNVEHSITTGLRKPIKRENHYAIKPVIAIKELAIMEFNSVSDCADALGVSKTAISSTIKRGGKSKGYKIEFI